MSERIQRQRTKGWRMPEGAVYVGRPTLFGNPWTKQDAITWNIPPADRAAWTVWKYQEELRHLGLLSDWGAIVSERRHHAVAQMGLKTMADYARRLLSGHDLACWCPLEDADGKPVPCHADVLLELTP